ncbi:ribonuclease H-like domain-containing protein [Tanacetum coccineum]
MGESDMETKLRGSGSFEPTTYYEAIKNPNWIEAVDNKIEALKRNNSWTICDLPEGRKAVGSKWLFKIKYKSTGTIDRYKDLFQLDINNAFLYGDLSEDVYMTLPPGFDTQKGKVCKLNKSLYGRKQAPRQWNSKLTMTLLENGFVQSKFDYSLFTKKSDKVCIALLVYVDDIVIIGNDLAEIERFKVFLKSKFQIKDLEKLKYFLGIEVLDNKEGICLSQYMHASFVSHLDFALRVLRYLKGSLGSGIQINKTENLKLRAYADSDWARCPATRKSVSGSSTEAKYRSMASATCEVIWLSNLLGDMGVKDLSLVVMYCDNSSALQIAANLMFHEKSKHFEIDVHLVREKVVSGVIKTKKIHTSQQIADVLTKALDIEQHKILCDKLGMLDMFKVENT